MTELTYIENIKDKTKASECTECRARLKRFISEYPYEILSKGQTFLLQDETPKGVFVIESGKVRSYTIASDGREQLVAIHSSGEDIPIGFALGLSEATRYFYEAYTKCIVRIIPRDEFIGHLRSSNEIMYQMQVNNTTQLMSTLSRINALEQPRAGNKILLTLVYLADRLGMRLWSKPEDLELSVTQSEIANLLGLTRETASSELKKLRANDIISYSRKSYTLHIRRLHQYLEKQQ